MINIQKWLILTGVFGALIIVGCVTDDKLRSASQSVDGVASKTSFKDIPADQFDLQNWKLTLSVDEDKNGKVDNVKISALQSYSHSDFFYLDDQNRMVFVTPNKGPTTRNSLSTRTELRYMSSGDDKVLGPRSPKNNFALAAHSEADSFASIGGKMEATLRVDHVPTVGVKPYHGASIFAAAVGQIHAVKYGNDGDGFGYGNEPLKIFYKKWPHHETGSVYWTYERNLAKGNPDRTDIVYPVWGHHRNNENDPGASGIALGEEFSYTANVHKNTLYLTFETASQDTVHHQINLANNIDANGRVDAADNPMGYTQDAHYFKAGVYNQCRGQKKVTDTKARCGGTGDWAIDKAEGHYFQASFSRLVVGPSTSPE